VRHSLTPRSPRNVTNASPGGFSRRLLSAASLGGFLIAALLLADRAATGQQRLNFLLADPTFVITSVSYTDGNGVVQTMNFDAKTQKAQIPAVACKNAITINGTITPTAANTMINGDVKYTSLKAGLPVVTAAPKLDGKGGWTLSVPAASLAPNTTNNVGTIDNLNNDNKIVINNTSITTTPTVVQIAAAP
jgi:hypothetical protein